ncbi:hypothetical protein HF668_11685 [Acidithiobacillus ferridurans]|uniref:hypothetical protein n=1 Tax=Acidithiobacillus ferridurans TaxID=1232575 RepID=UPI001C067B66|nr:hypothetical protein [Acidithiobacillus ferridurans]MBU2805792.1 hypothetical protein [Acidithiobacillus ferridurans]
MRGGLGKRDEPVPIQDARNTASGKKQDGAGYRADTAQAKSDLQIAKPKPRKIRKTCISFPEKRGWTEEKATSFEIIHLSGIHFIYSK